MVYGGGFDMETMPQTVPSSIGFSSSFDYSTFQFDLSLLPEDYNAPIVQQGCNLKPTHIKQEMQSPRPNSPTTYPSPPYSGVTGDISPNYSLDGSSPGYPTSPYYIAQSPQSAQLYINSPDVRKQPVKREKSFDLLAILQESRLLAESLGHKDDSTDCTVPCTPPRTEEDIYNTLDTDFFPKRESTNVLLKEMLFKEEPLSSNSSVSSSPIHRSNEIHENSSLRDSSYEKIVGNNDRLSDIDEDRHSLSGDYGSLVPKIEINDEGSINTRDDNNTRDIVKSDDDVLNDADEKPDHQLLREVLRDTSFQRKYNLRPIDLGNVGTGYVEDMNGNDCVGDLPREQIEPVLSLAIQQLQKDFDNTCVALGIHPEPRRWSAADVAAWVQWARRQLQLPSVPLESFNIDGSILATLTEEDFCQRAPQCGSMLHAQLEIWKAAVEESPRNTLAASWSLPGMVGSPGNGNPSPSSSMTSVGPVALKASTPCAIDFSDEEDDDAATTATTNSTGKMRNGGSHIHLWQFLKELLQSPGIHGSCIRWLDRTKGVFKIEDSVRVARLWGKRKNRPAMNYDKLSRSIRQYYKKGIMKKTERSQRLVYQFCHPYCL